MKIKVIFKMYCNEAAEYGDIEYLKFCKKLGCTLDEDTCALSAENGHLDISKYLH